MNLKAFLCASILFVVGVSIGAVVNQYYGWPGYIISFITGWATVRLYINIKVKDEKKDMKNENNTPDQ